jgi:uncharacterized RDD family membrane protein YckC
MVAGGSPFAAQRHGDYAGFVTRMVAFVTDRIIIALVLGGAAIFVDFAAGTFQLKQAMGLQTLTAGLAAAIAAASGIGLAMIYDVGFWVLAGQTPGKRLMGLLVVRSNGARLKLGSALLRWVGYWVSGILFLGFLWVLLDSKRQGFHDKLARTLVVYARPEAAGVAAATPIHDRLSGLTREQGTAKEKPA